MPEADDYALYLDLRRSLLQVVELLRDGVPADEALVRAAEERADVCAEAVTADA